ncbi:SMP-30/gluconolactonase/LRE family protein [Maribacter algarum]|uniref:SMP-30/gluconolactonase/LRE family protein n=2 Tax=Maribacter algarum (ex Zhang et al. 2020) TaxID=2578118 RepID=A0A5S3PPY9_9FLAO|nr:SMP-30/gluconolactonase/LRE family protein [Maribacter algarum]
MKTNLVLVALTILFLNSCKEVKKEEASNEESNEITYSLDELKKQRTDWQPRSQEEMKALFAIEILDDKALNIIDEDTEIKILANGFTWTEGPVWVKDGNYLLFSDIPNNKVFRLDAQRDTVTYLHPSGFSGDAYSGAEPGSNGLLVNAEGELVLMQHGNRAVSKMKNPMASPKEVYEILVNNYEGKRLNSPNDGAFDADGNLYFTDPPYGLPGLLEDPNKELDFQGVYCLLKTGELVLLDKSLKYPNGLCISPDGKKLIVAVSNIEKAAYYEYEIVSPGKVENKKIFYNVDHFLSKEGYQGLPDGIKITKLGYVLATGPKGLLIFNMSGKLLARVHTGQLTANCALGKDEKTLYMTAHDHIISIALK